MYLCISSAGNCCSLVQKNCEKGCCTWHCVLVLRLYNPSCYGCAVILGDLYVCSKISGILSSNDIGWLYVNQHLEYATTSPSLCAMDTHSSVHAGVNLPKT